MAKALLPHEKYRSVQKYYIITLTNHIELYIL